MIGNNKLDEGIQLRFKGDRNYLHGTDLFDALINEFSPRESVSLRLYKPMYHPVRYEFYNDGTVMTDRVATFEYIESGVKETFVILEIPKNSVIGRYKYEEDIVTKSAMINENQISINTGAEYSLVEKVVALHKLLLNTIRGEKVDWWFSQINLKKLPKTNSHVLLELTTKPRGRLVRSSIYVGDEMIGNIFFSEKIK
jgi:hypothetical protein